MLFIRLQTGAGKIAMYVVHVCDKGFMFLQTKINYAMLFFVVLAWNVYGFVCETVRFCYLFSACRCIASKISKQTLV